MGSLFFRVIQVDCQNNRPEDRYGNRGEAEDIVQTKVNIWAINQKISLALGIEQ